VAREFHPTPVGIHRADARQIIHILEVVLSNSANEVWTHEGTATISTVSGIRTRLMAQTDAAEASDAVRHRFEDAGDSAPGSWELVDGEPVAYHHGGTAYPVTDHAPIYGFSHDAPGPLRRVIHGDDGTTLTAKRQPNADAPTERGASWDIRKKHWWER
jgi:hypothetical protein